MAARCWYCYDVAALTCQWRIVISSSDEQVRLLDWLLTRTGCLYCAGVLQRIHPCLYIRGTPCNSTTTFRLNWSRKISLRHQAINCCARNCAAFDNFGQIQQTCFVFHKWLLCNSQRSFTDFENSESMMKLVLTMSSFRTTYRVQGGAIKNHERYFLNSAAHLQRTIWDGEHRGNKDSIENQCCRFFFELTRALAFAMFRALPLSPH